MKLAHLLRRWIYPDSFASREVTPYAKVHAALREAARAADSDDSAVREQDWRIGQDGYRAGLQAQAG